MRGVKAFLVILAMTGPAHAELVSEDLTASGDGLVTRDTTTGFRWLDLTVTRGMSPQNVLSSTFVTELGFRFGTMQEVQRMWVQNGVIDNGSATAANLPAARQLLDLMGNTGASNSLGTGDGAFHDFVNAAIAGFDPTGVPIEWGFAPAGFVGISTDGSVGLIDPTYGTALIGGNPDGAWYLVQPVPLPSSAWLLGAALMAGAASFKRRGMDADRWRYASAY